MPHLELLPLYRAWRRHLRIIVVRMSIGSLIIALGLLSGCPAHDRTTIRIIGGRPQPGRYVSPNAYANYLQAMLRVGRGDYSGAKPLLKAAIAFDPDSPYLHTRLAEAHVALNEPAQAEAEIAQALELRTGFIDAMLLRATMQRRAGDLAGAKQTLATCVNKNPGAERAVVQLTELLINEGQPQRARALLVEQIRRSPRALRAHQRLGLLCLQLLDYRCAAKVYRRSLSLKADLQTVMRLAHVYRALGDPRRAAKLLREAFDRSGGHTSVASNLAQALRALGDQRAVADLIAVMARAAGDDPQAIANVAELATSVGQAKLALELLRAHKAPAARLAQAAALDKQGHVTKAETVLRGLLGGEADELAVLRLASIFRRSGRLADATTLLREARKRHPPSDALALALARSLSEQGHARAAVALIEAALAERPTQRLRFALAGVLDHSGRWREAVETMRALLAIRKKDAARPPANTRGAPNPSLAAIHNFIGYTLADHNHQLDQAERHLRRALTLQPGAGYIIDSMGWLYFRRGRHADAQRLLQMAVHLSPHEPEILAHLGEASAALNQHARALSLFKRARKRSTSRSLNRQIDRWLDRLKRGRVGSRNDVR